LGWLQPRSHSGPSQRAIEAPLARRNGPRQSDRDQPRFTEDGPFTPLEATDGMASHGGRRGGALVRRVREDEWEAARDLRLLALKTDPMAFGSTLERETAFPEELWRTRTGDGASSVSSSTWVAEDPEHRLVGMGSIVEIEGTLHVFAMWVDPEFRGRGVGGEILDAGLEWARANHPRRRLILEVNPTQSPAMALYQSRGFRFTGISRPIGHSPGVDVKEMEFYEPS